MQCCNFFSCQIYLHIDLPLVFDEENHIAMLLVLFDLFVGGFANIRYSYAGCLELSKQMNHLPLELVV